MPTYSYSKLSTFKSCPLQYRFRYVDRRKMDVGPTIEAFLGQRVHEVLEWLYGQVQNQSIPTLEELLARYAALWEAEWRDDVRIVKRDLDADSYRRVGEEALRRYAQRHHPYDHGIVLGLEKRFRFPLDEGHTINGVIDRLMRVGDGKVEVHDYKTSASLPTPEQAAADRQAGVYEMAARRLFPDASEVRLVWHYLRFDQRLTGERTPFEREALTADLLAEMRIIEATSDFPPRESALCDWCEFYSICPAKIHAQTLAELDERQRVIDSGLALVDRMAELRDRLSEQRSALEREIEEAEQQLAAYAAREGLTTVVGTTHEAVIDRQPKLAFPAKGDPQREALEDAVRRRGLWDRVADLGIVQLRSLLESGEVSEDVAAELRAFATVEPRVQVRLRRRSEDRVP
jgi:putative RecB family exonuclease